MEEQEREVLSRHETIARYLGVRVSDNRHLKVLNPPPSTSYRFEIEEYLAYEKPGRFGDAKKDAAGFDEKEQKEEIIEKLKTLEEGDKVSLIWTHDYVKKSDGRRSSSAPERVIEEVEKIEK